MTFTVVKLKQLNSNCNALGLSVGLLGLLLQTNGDKALVLFFNENNYGDYLITTLDVADIEATDMVLPTELSNQLVQYVAENAKIFESKTAFDSMPFAECDIVELTVEDSRYSKFGLHKGSRGVVALSRATNGSILVDFGTTTANFDGFVSVDFNDLVKIDG